jgi:cellobiose transport system permease protein
MTTTMGGGTILEPPERATVRASARTQRLRGRAPQDTKASVWTYLALTGALLFSAFPLYWMFVVATGTEASISRVPPQVTPESHFFDNLREVLGLQDVFLAQSLVNSFIVSFIVTVSTLFFCSLAGFAFAKLRFRFSRALMVFVILTLAIPNQLGVVALYIIMSKLPLGDGDTWNGHLIAVIVPSLVGAFGLFYMRQFILGSVPDELVESARVDGATTMRIYWSIVLPSIRPALAVLGLLTFVAAWNDFQWPLITLNGTEHPTSMVAISDLASGVYVQYRRVLSGAFLATLPLLVMLFVGGRQIVRGIMEGAVKQ